MRPEVVAKRRPLEVLYSAKASGLHFKVPQDFGVK